MNMHCQIRLVVKKNQQFRTYITEIAMILLCEPKVIFCDLDLENINPFLAHGTLAFNDVSPYWVW